MERKLFAIKLTGEEHEEWKSAAKKEDRTMACVVRRAMTQYLERQRAKAAKND